MSIFVGWIFLSIILQRKENKPICVHILYTLSSWSFCLRKNVHHLHFMSAALQTTCFWERCVAVPSKVTLQHIPTSKASPLFLITETGKKPDVERDAWQPHDDWKCLKVEFTLILFQHSALSVSFSLNLSFTVIVNLWVCECVLKWGVGGLSEQETWQDRWGDRGFEPWAAHDPDRWVKTDLKRLGYWWSPAGTKNKPQHWPEHTHKTQLSCFLGFLPHKLNFEMFWTWFLLFTVLNQAVCVGVLVCLLVTLNLQVIKKKRDANSSLLYSKSNFIL